MGLDNLAFEVTLDFHGRHIKTAPCSVVELGAQSIACPFGVPSKILANLGPDVDKTDITDYVVHGGVPAGPLYRVLGYKKYCCIDVNALWQSLPYDLNFNLQHKYGFYEQFDLVTNHGTSEHVLNQAAVFENMHNLCKPEGFMFHVVPMLGFLNHCFFNYHPLMFASLAHANHYEVERLCAYFPGKKRIDLHDLADKAIERSCRESSLNELNCNIDMFVVFKKTSEAPFVLAQQIF